MKLFLPFAGSLALSALLLPAFAQTPTVTRTTVTPPQTATKTAAHRAATYKGPKVVKDSKNLGDKMLRDSKPASDRPLPAPVKK